MDLKQYTQPDIVGKRVVLRADLDVNVNEAGEVSEFDDLRLQRAASTIKELLGHGAAQIIIIGKRGRPQGIIDTNFSLAPVQRRLSNLVAQAIKLIADPNQQPGDYKNDSLLMIENLEFWPGELNNDSAFASRLADWGEVYISDAFAKSHRTVASLVAITKFLPAFAGPGLVNEIKHLSEFTENPVHPYVVVLGGAKIETKLPLIKSFLNKADTILLGGGLANTFFKAQGWEIGKSLVDDPFLDEARSLLNPKLILPIDVTITDGQGAVQTVPVTAVPADGFIGDIGPQTVALYKEKLASARMVLFNGPMGKFEDEIYSHGTKGLVAAIIGSQAKTLTGGGDTLDLVQSLGVVDKFSFVSVGGGAMLTFLAGEPMPALEVLRV